MLDVPPRVFNAHCLMLGYELLPDAIVIITCIANNARIAAK